MRLDSPRHLHYPITVTDLLQRPHTHVDRATPLFAYSFKSTVTEGDEFGGEHDVERTFPTHFECPIEGTLLAWSIEPGTVITHPNTPLVDIEEACTHHVQFGGLCVDCGKDMTEIDYNTSVPNTQRANTSIAHIHPALKISNEEATRIDHEAKQRLLGIRKLSLVVDLDLTIIHASVDPTIGDWQRDPHNPNHNAVSDVRSFELWDDAMGRDVSYYIKLRPHLKTFLETVSRIYELYIYTMGTRAYADNIAKIVDPDKKLFGERILSRTETPGEDSKNLRKLFPVDNRMVVIIDDRADVWKWSNYLVRVQPFNFFVGIGDINASFLPKRDDILDNGKVVESPPDPRQDQVEGATVDEPKPKSKDTAQEPTPPPSPDAPADGDESALGQIVTMQESSADASMQKKTAEQDENLAAQLHDRPLLQLQKSLEDESMPQDHNLLKDDDSELVRVQDVLVNVHRGFFEQFDSARVTSTHVPQEVQDIQCVPDVKDILEPLLSKPLRDVRVVFSRVIPLGTDIFKTRWADIALKLGAVVQTDLQMDTTHLVTKMGDPTVKMRHAAARGIKIVRDDWLWDQSIQWWGKIDEAPYEIYVDARSSARQRVEGDGSKGGSREESEDEDDSTTRDGLTIDTDVNGTSNGDGELKSPEGDFRDAGWDDAFDELDGLDDVSDTDDDEESASDASGSQTSTVSVRGSKRKLDEGGAGESMLQKRRRKALERTSSLTNVQQADSSEADEGEGEEAADKDDEDNSDFDEAAFYAALQAQDEGDNDDDGGGG